MATQKTDLLIVGKGDIRNNADSAIVFSSNILVGAWDLAVTYVAGNVVEYSGYLYRCLLTNTNSTPSLVNADWEVLLAGPKDGDIALIVNGATSNMQQRQSGMWVSSYDVPVTMNLVDGQLTPAVAITFLGNAFNYADFIYTIKRGPLHGRKRKGEMTILNDGSTALDYSNEWTDIGSDVNVVLTPVMNAGNVEIQYTSAAEGIVISLKYLLKGWS
jgi:hypothetical protein